MSSVVMQHNTIAETVRAVLDPIPWMPVAVAGITMPYWMAWWQATGSFFGALAQVLGAGLIGYKLWQAWRDRHDETDVAKERLPRTVEAGAKAAVSVGKLTKTGLTVLALTGAVMGFLYWVAHKQRKDPPTAILSVASMPAARRRKTSDDDGGDEPNGEGDTGEPLALPSYYCDALADERAGLAEALPNGKANPAVQIMFPKSGLSAKTDCRNTPWCMVYVNYRLEQRNIQGTGKANALSIAEWGEKVPTDKRRVGDIVFFKRLVNGRWDGWSGHIGFYAGEAGSGRIKVLGGNQSDMVCFKTFPISLAIGFRRPRGLYKSHTAWAGATAATTGAGATGVAGAALTGALDEETPSTVETITQGVERIAEPMMQSGHPKMMKIALLIILGCTVVGALAGAYALYRRSQDFKSRGY